MGTIDCTMSMHLFSPFVFVSVSRWSGLADWLFAVTSVSRPFLTGLVTSLRFGRHTLFIAVSHHLRPTSDLEEPNSSTYGVIPQGLICTCFAKIEKWLCEIVTVYVEKQSSFFVFFYISKEAVGGASRWGQPGAVFLYGMYPLLLLCYYCALLLSCCLCYY